jgi:hypothetical protein
MNEEITNIKEALDVARGQSAVINLLMMALIAQAPDKQRLLKDFAEMVEDTTIRAMYSSHPEAFLRAAQSAAKTWTSAIEER